MKELVSIIVNTLASMGNEDRMTISKKSDTEFVFSGRGQDGGVPYKYEVAIKYIIGEQADDEDERIRAAVQKELARINAAGKNDALAQTLAADIERMESQKIIND